MQYITASQLKEEIASGVISAVIDIREPYEREICVIDSIHIPMGELKDRFQEIPKEGKVVILCKTGRRAEATTNFLEKDFQFSNLFILQGGIIGWIEAVDNNLEAY